MARRLRRVRKIAFNAPAPRPARAFTFRSTTNKRAGYTAGYMELVSKSVDEASKQLPDPFFNFEYTGNFVALKTPYPMHKLAKLPHENNVLRQCIESYVVNIESYGYILEYIGPEGQENGKAQQSEKRRLESFLAAPSPELTLRQIRENTRYDKETLGNRYYEISRNLKGEIVMLDAVPGVTMRLSKRDDKPTEVEIDVPDPDGDGYVKKTVLRYFRRFIQQGVDGEWVFFKEFGDPRSIDPKNGSVNPSLPIEAQATEIYHDYLYTPGQVYGLPRWIGQLPAILGSRESELVNLNFFRENAIPAMAVLVSGGALTEESFDRIQNYITAVRGRDAMQRVMVVEAAADTDGGSIDHSQPAPKIELKPMISERQQEGLFQDYDQKNMQKVRQAFRLPPIYIGRAEDYTRASALASMITAENQIFKPERMAFDEFMNTRILTSYKPQFWRFRSLGPSLAEPETLSTMIESFGAQGALTPNAVIKIANKMLDIDIKPVLDKWGDYPFSAIMGYINKGAKIDGLDEFVTEMLTVAAPPANQNADPNADNSAGGGTGSGKKPAKKPRAGASKLRKAPTPARTLLRRRVRDELGSIASDLREAQAATLQASARIAA